MARLPSTSIPFDIQYFSSSPGESRSEACALIASLPRPEAFQVGFIVFSHHLLSMAKVEEVGSVVHHLRVENNPIAQQQADHESLLPTESPLQRFTLFLARYGVETQGCVPSISSKCRHPGEEGVTTQSKMVY